MADKLTEIPKLETLAKAAQIHAEADAVKRFLVFLGQHDYCVAKIDHQGNPVRGTVNVQRLKAEFFGVDTNRLHSEMKAVQQAFNLGSLIDPED